MKSVFLNSLYSRSKINVTERTCVLTRLTLFSLAFFKKIAANLQQSTHVSSSLICESGNRELFACLYDSNVYSTLNGTFRSHNAYFTHQIGTLVGFGIHQSTQNQKGPKPRTLTLHFFEHLAEQSMHRIIIYLYHAHQRAALALSKHQGN